MNKVFACVDGVGNTAAVCDCAAWSALRLDVPLEFLHVLDRHPERAPVRDLSGAIGLGAQESLLQELSALDERRSKLAQEHGRQLLQAAKQRAAQAGVERVDARQRHGELVETVLEMEADARLFVMGEHHHATGTAKLHLDHHVERVIRAVKRPVLVVTHEEFEAPQRFGIAFDGSATGRKTVETLARSPMLKGLPCCVLMAREDDAFARDQISWARTTLAAAGFEVDAAVLAGEPEAVLAQQIRARGIGLLVMGAYGHSRIRNLIVGSTTTTMLRTSEVPVLILR